MTRFCYDLKMKIPKANGVKPEWVLRVGLGVMYIYSGLNIFSNPSAWHSFVPQWFEMLWNNIGPIEIFLKIQGLGELMLGLLFLAWFSGKRGVFFASLLASLEIFLILLFVGVDLVTFRDIGVFSAALSLLIISWPEKNKSEFPSPTSP